MKKWLTVLLALAMMLSTACAAADDLRLYRQTTGGEATVTLSNKGAGVYQATLESGGV